MYFISLFFHMMIFLHNKTINAGMNNKNVDSGLLNCDVIHVICNPSTQVSVAIFVTHEPYSLLEYKSRFADF